MHEALFFIVTPFAGTALYEQYQETMRERGLLHEPEDLGYHHATYNLSANRTAYAFNVNGTAIVVNIGANTLTLNGMIQTNAAGTATFNSTTGGITVTAFISSWV